MKMNPVTWLAAGVLAAGLALPSAVLAQELSPVGRWRTVDDKTGQAKSIVEIVEVDGEYRGQVEKVFAPPAEKPDPLCDLCPGDRKGKPILGMTIMWGLKRDGGEYNGGQVLDPDNGKTYRCKLKIVDGGTKLELRGFIGISLLGRTQIWLREGS